MVKRIFLSADFTREKPEDADRTNTDVIVEMDNGDQYVSIFASTGHLKNVLNEAHQDVPPNFYRILNLVLIKDFDEADLSAVIETMLAEGDFQLAFRKL